jgi:heme a synthase
VAGNDAGNAYNTFPMMGDVWIPAEVLDMEPKWRNFFENTATVQLDHRVLALSTAAAIAGMYAAARRGGVWAVLPYEAKRAITATAGMAGLQVRLHMPPQLRCDFLIERDAALTPACVFE